MKGQKYEYRFKIFSNVNEIKAGVNKRLRITMSLPENM